MSTYKVLQITYLTPDTFRLRTERPNVPIRAGQCFNVGLPGTSTNRESSMYSGANDDYLDFLIRTVEGGCVSPVLRGLKAGDSVEINGPYGEFCLREPVDTSRPHVFLASGTGIAPFHSYAATYPGLNYKVVHGVRHVEEQYGAADYPSGSYIPCISKGGPGHEAMRVTDYLRKSPVSPDSVVYLCGNRNMIIDAFEILREQGVPGDNLFTEVFF